ncbi:MAG: ZIP family metal transporter [Bacilli bacterium]|nr:ZIP family metal transporter [Bacilli bacterium]
MELFALLLTFILGLFILLGTIIVLITKNNEKFVSFSLALAFGVMVSLSIFELFPESYEHLEEMKNGRIPLLFGCIMIGIILLKLLDHFIPHHALDEGHHHSKKEHMEHLYHIGIVSSFALVLHNLIEGMAIYGTASTSTHLGLLVGLGVGLHNIPMGMVIASTFYKSSENKKKTVMISFLISISTFIGGLLMFFLNGIMKEELILGILLGITLGMIIYIALFELLEQMIHSKNKKETIFGIFLGIFILFLSLVIGGHHH